MQNIKNFTVTEPTEEQREMGPQGATFLTSEDGQDWYECKKNFADFTIKIMYDSNDVIRSVVDEPVPTEGGIYAVSMFFPVNMSVAEVASLPDGFKLNEWQFVDGEIVPREYTHDELVERAGANKKRLMAAAAKAIAPLQDAVDTGEATDEEKAQLLELKRYNVSLYRLDTSLAPDIEWPPVPVFTS